MNCLDTLRKRAPEIAPYLDFPGGYASSVRMARFREHRRLARLRDARPVIGGRDVRLYGPLPLLENMLRQGAFQDLNVISAHAPDDSTGEVFVYDGEPVSVSPGKDLEGISNCVVLCFSDPDFVVGKEVALVDLADEDLAESPFLADHCSHVIERATRSMETVFEPGNTILFAGNVEYFNFLRVSEALRARGFRTIFLGLSADSARFKERFFDLSLNADGNIEVFYRLLNAFPFLCVHFQGWMENHEYAAAAIALSDNPVVVEFNDLPHYFLDPEEYDAVFGQERFVKEDVCLKYIARNAAGLLGNCMSSYFERFLEMLGASGRTAWAPFHGYPHVPFFSDRASENVRSVVFPGSLIPTNFPASAFADGQVLRLIRKYVAPQDVEYHVYANPFSGSGGFERFWDYHQFAHGDSRLRLHTGLPPNELTWEISKLGFGAMFYLLDGGFKVLMEHYRSLLPTKVFTMFEAGLPIIYNEEFEYLDQIASEWGLGIRVSQDDIKAGIGPLIDQCDYEELRRNVVRFREAWSMDAKVEDALAVYEKAAEASFPARGR